MPAIQASEEGLILIYIQRNYNVVPNVNKCEGIPVVDGEGEVVSWRGEAVASSPGHGGGEVPAGLEGAAGDCGEHSGEASLK